MTEPLDVSPHDDRTYRLATLPNGLRALLASDPSAEYASAAMCVSVGAGYDPVHLPGLAHFCEHMLFLGSAKYPEESAYKKFLAAHGGRSNASTSMDTTVYKFEVLAAHLEEVLDIFAQFFVEPLFTESATERELNAVDAEDSKNRTNDGRRILQVLKAAADAPEHPWTKFSTGNSTTLQGGGVSPALSEHARGQHSADSFAQCG
jgi:insulysin